MRLGAAGELARDDGDRAVFAKGAGRRQDHAEADPDANGGQRDHAEDLPVRGAQRARRLLLLGADLAQHRDHLTRDEWDGDEEGRQDHPRQGEDDAEAVIRQPATELTATAVDDDQRQADDDWRDTEWQIEQRGQDLLAAKFVADDEQREEDAEDRVQRHGDERR